MLRSIVVIITLVLSVILSSSTYARSNNLQTTLKTFGELQQIELEEFSQNNILFYDPSECVSKGASASSCFKVDNNVEAQSSWYAEGCLDNGTCTSGKYASTAFTSGHNSFLLNETETDEDFGGMQYIYAENYDIEFDGIEGWIAKFTKNGGTSTRKYYWIVLPAEAYATGFGETYVATFEKLSEPVYFITYDTHQCAHQSADYCGKANRDPDGVAIGEEFFGAFTKNGGNYSEAANITGKLISFCRINGRGDITVSENKDNLSAVSSRNTASTSSSAPNNTNVTNEVSVAGKIWNWFTGANISGLSDNPAAIAGIIGAFATEAGGNTIEGLTPFSWSDWGGTLLGCIPQYCGDIKNKVTEAVGNNYFAYKTGVDGIPEDAVDKAIDLELKFMMDDYNSGINWKTFVENLNVVSNKTPESYAELFEVIVQNAADSSGDAVQDQGVIEWVANHSGYSTVQQVLNKKRELARKAYEKLAKNNCTTYEGDYPQYYQQTGYTCGPTSMAMLATAAAGQDVLESDVIDAVGSDRAYANTRGSGMVALDKKVCEKYGCEVVGVDTIGTTYKEIADKMRQYLNNGYLIHLSGAGSKPFSNVGHYIGIFGFKGDKVITADSSNGNQEYDLDDLISRGYHGDQFSAIKGYNNSKNSCENYCSVGESSDGINSGGFDSVEEAEKVVMDPYRELVGKSGEWSKYHITAGTPYNCFSFSNYFITRYTTISDFYGVPGVDGGGYAEEFYNLYHEKYPGLKLSNTPTPYSVAGCGDKYYKGNGSPSHTFIVLGINSDNGTMLYGQAAFGYGPSGVYAAEIGLDANNGYHVGPQCQYTDFSKYVTGL